MPGATIADAAGGGMHAALAVMAALVGRGERRVRAPSSTCRWPTGSCGSCRWPSTSTWPPGPSRAPATTSSPVATPATTPTAAADGKWLAVGAIEPKFFANLCRALGCEQWTDHQYDDDVQDAIRADFRAAFARRDRDTWVAELSGADTCVAPVQAVAEIVADEQYGARRAIVDGRGREHAGRRRPFPPGRAGAGRHGRGWPSRWRARPAPADTDELLAAAGVAAERIAELRAGRVVA